MIFLYVTKVFCNKNKNTIYIIKEYSIMKNVFEYFFLNNLRG